MTDAPGLRTAAPAGGGMSAEAGGGMSAQAGGEMSADVLVIGGGVIGLACAWRARLSGADVIVVDPSPGRGASWAAAGMIAPVTEAHFGEQALLQLNLRSAAAWGGFRDELQTVTGADLGYRGDGTLAVAFDAGDRDALAELFKFQQELGLESTWFAPADCRAAEPLLAPAIRGGLFVNGDHSVDPRRLVNALVEACIHAGVVLVEDAVTALALDGDDVDGAFLDGGTSVRAGRTLLAAGWETALLKGLAEHARPPVRPVKGQILRLRMPAGWPLPAHTVRAISQGSSIYVVVRADGEIVCGATVEELGPDRRVTGGGIYSLLRDAQLVLPVLLEAEFVEAIAGLRPGSPDNAPLIGPSGMGRLLIATGHYRNGILLAPVTASLTTELLASAEAAPDLPDWAKAFDPRRFSADSG